MPNSNPIINAIRSRRSIRGYQPGPVSEDQLKTIVDCGRLAPTALNEQNWEFIVITESKPLHAMAEMMPENAPFLVDVPAAIAVTGRKDHHSVYLDGAAATQNMLLATHALNLGGCWIQAFEKPYNSQIMELLQIPETHTLVSIISLGVPFGNADPPQKRPLESVLHWEKF